MERPDDMRNTSEIVHSVLILIVQLCENIIKANICMNDLMKCLSGTGPSPLQALCLAANSGRAPLCQKFYHVNSAMDLCSKKFDFVQQFNIKLEVVVKHCSKISEGTLFGIYCLCMHVCTMIVIYLYFKKQEAILKLCSFFNLWYQEYIICDCLCKNRP